MENFNSNNVNLQRRDAKSKQLTNEQRHGILQQLLHTVYEEQRKIRTWCAINKLIKCVQDTFNKLERNTLDNVFITLQTIMDSIILKGGRNFYKIPRTYKGKTSS